MSVVTPTFLPKLSFHIPVIKPSVLGPQYRDQDFVRQFVAIQFEKRQVGKVSRVDLVLKQNNSGRDYYEAFVHFQKWFKSSRSLSLRRAACGAQKATLPLVGHRSYWIVNQNNSPVYEEDWQSILTAIPAARWVQAGDEQELISHIRRTRAARTVQHCVRTRLLAQPSSEYADLHPAVRELFLAHDEQLAADQERLQVEIEMGKAVGFKEQRLG